MTRRSIRTAWPRPPRHRHRRTTSPRWGTAGRVVLGLVALLAGILAMNGVIQSTMSPSRTAGSGPDVDIASLLPPAAAAETPADPVARSSESHPTPTRRPAAEAQVTPRTSATSRATTGSPTTSRRVEAAPSTSARDRSDDDERGSTDDDRKVNRSDDADHSSVDEESKKTSTAKQAPSRSGRSGRPGPLPHRDCADEDDVDDDDDGRSAPDHC